MFINETLTDDTHTVKIWNRFLYSSGESFTIMTIFRRSRYCGRPSQSAGHKNDHDEQPNEPNELHSSRSAVTTLLRRTRRHLVPPQTCRTGQIK